MSDPVSIAAGVFGDSSLICNDCTYSCAACGDKIEYLAIVGPNDKAWCRPCFKCHRCNKPIKNLKYAWTSTGISCQDCHTCCKCKKQLEGGRLRHTSRGWYCKVCTEESRQRRLKRPHHSRSQKAPHSLDTRLPELPAVSEYDQQSFDFANF